MAMSEDDGDAATEQTEDEGVAATEQTQDEGVAATEQETEADADYNGGMGTVPGTKNYTYLTVGGQPPEAAMLQVGETIYRSGDKVPLSEELHDALVRDGHSFKEDIETTEPKKS